jgi:hypothetical protein
MKRTKTRLKKALLSYYPQVFEAIESGDTRSLTLLSSQVCHDGDLGRYAYDEAKYPAMPSGDAIGEEGLARLEGFLAADDKAAFVRSRSADGDAGLVWFLYGALWQAGEAKRLTHLLTGVRDYVTGAPYREDGTLKAWYALGRHIASGGRDPLVNKQVTRAHKVYRAGYDLAASKLKSPEPEDHALYHRWMKARELGPQDLHLAHKALFTLGNATKVLL